MSHFFSTPIPSVWRANKICNPKSRRFMRLQGLSGYIRALTVAKRGDNLHVISISNEGTVNVWNALDGQLLHTLKGDLNWGRAVLFSEAVALSADGRVAIAYSDEGVVQKWNIDSGQPTRTLEGYWIRARTAALTTDGRFAILGFQDGIIAMWDTKTGKGLCMLQAHSAPVTAVALTWTGVHAITASEDNTVKLWDLLSGSVMASFTGESSMYALAITSDFRTIVAGEASGRVHFLHLEGI